MTKREAQKLLAKARPLRIDGHDEWRRDRNKRKRARKVMREC